MKYNTKNLAKAFYILAKEDSQNYQAIIAGFIDFCKAKRLVYLFPNLIRYLKIEAKREEYIKRLKIFSATDLNESTIKKIQKLAEAEELVSVEIIKDKEILAGFVAHYQNKIIDASLNNNLRLLKRELISI